MSHNLSRIFFVCFLLWLPAFSALSNWNFDDDSDSTVHIEEVDNYAALLDQAKKENKIIMLEMSASYCGYCKQLEEDIIKPMMISGDYDDVIIKQLKIDSYYSIEMPNKQSVSASDFARQKNVYVTPTLLFLNHKGEEVAKRIIGINSVDYFGAYVDDALLKGKQSQ